LAILWGKCGGNVGKKGKSTRKTPMTRTEIENITKRLIVHYGKTRVENILNPAKTIKDKTSVLVLWRKKLEDEIEQQKIDIDDYYKEIDAEFKNVCRPSSIFNRKEFEYLCSIGCNIHEISGFFRMNTGDFSSLIKDEYGESFTEISEKFSQGVKISLRRAQIKKAIIDGDGPMQKFLGINMLGQKNKIDFDGEVKVNSWVDLVNNLENEKNEDEKK
jgi:hypothetical protein